MGVCLLTGITAKEIVVSTMGVLYQDEGNPGASLSEKIRNTHSFTPLATLSFLIFTLLYFPCLATITAIFNESGSWKWAAFSLFFTTGLAWMLSFIIYQTGILLR
jgi:ferrous iron transport protein B